MESVPVILDLSVPPFKMMDFDPFSAKVKLHVGTYLEVSYRYL